MNRLHIATRGACSWRDRLAKPDTQWERRYSAMETAMSWEFAAASNSGSTSGLPQPIEQLFINSIYAHPTLLLAIAEHKVPLAGRGGDSQCDVWALVRTAVGSVSLSVEAKAREPFGKGNQSLDAWVSAEQSDAGLDNRRERWAFIQNHLPPAVGDSYSTVAYQLLHRCAAAVIEARRFALTHAAFVVQAFDAPAESFAEYSKLCVAMGVSPERGCMVMVRVGDIMLALGWADCPLASDAQIAAVV